MPAEMLSEQERKTTGSTDHILAPNHEAEHDAHAAQSHKDKDVAALASNLAVQVGRPDSLRTEKEGKEKRMNE